jgi:hypothetical protein
MNFNFLQIPLRSFGLVWMIGGVYTFQQARQSDAIDTVLEALTQSKEDKLTNRFLYIGSVLTFSSGLGLVILSRWVLLPLGLLVGSQLVYFRLKQQRRFSAQTEEQKLDAKVYPSTVNAFWVSVGVAIAALVGLKLGLLK